jgi:predicted metalloprotease with PDZ domain
MTRRSTRHPRFGRLGAIAVTALAAHPAAAQMVGGPVQRIDRPAIAVPVDHPFAGTIAITVDARDVAHKLFAVEERVPVSGERVITLLYPRWEAASHGPSLSVTDVAGLTISADGQPVAWARDPVTPHAFHLTVPAGARDLEIRYQIVADADLLSPDTITLPWQRLVLYPAGWYARNIPIAATATLPPGLRIRSSLDGLAGDTSGDGLVTRFATTSLETLLDSPVYAARYATTLPLSRSGPAVTLDLIASRPGDLAVPPAQLDDLHNMVEQARAVFGAAPYNHYAFLARMADGEAAGGTEHRRSSEIRLPSDYFREWANHLNDRDILAHEFVHAWNGLYRVPADLFAPTPNEPQGGSLLWVYEGQTEFWGRVLAARAGLRTREETLDRLAIDAAEVAHRPGRAWRPLSDDVNYASFMLRQPVPWPDWQRRKDYYDEGVLLWLDIDARLREGSGGQVGLDAFAQLFFAGATPDGPARTYGFADLCAALNAVMPGDWAAILHQWIDGHDNVDVLAGLRRDGWRLVYSDVPSATYLQNEEELGGTDLTYSAGMVVAEDGRVRAVAWDAPAFRAGLAPKAKIVAVGSAPFSRDALLDAVRHSEQVPITLTIDQDGSRRTTVIPYKGPLRYPRLERIADGADRLSPLLRAR